MTILMYWCPKHHTTSRLTRAIKDSNGAVKFTKCEDPDHWNGYKTIYRAEFSMKIPTCPICRQPMVRKNCIPKKNEK